MRVALRVMASASPEKCVCSRRSILVDSMAMPKGAQLDEGPGREKPAPHEAADAEGRDDGTLTIAGEPNQSARWPSSSTKVRAESPASLRPVQS